MTDAIDHGGSRRHGGPPIHELALAPGVVVVRVAESTVAYVGATMELFELSAAAATLVATLRDGHRHRVRRPGTLARQLVELGVLELTEAREPAPTTTATG